MSIAKHLKLRESVFSTFTNSSLLSHRDTGQTITMDDMSDLSDFSSDEISSISAESMVWGEQILGNNCDEYNVFGKDSQLYDRSQSRIKSWGITSRHDQDLIDMREIINQVANAKYQDSDQNSDSESDLESNLEEIKVVARNKKIRLKIIGKFLRSIKKIY